MPRKPAKKRRTAGSAPLMVIGGTRETVKVLKELAVGLQLALTLGRELTAQELARQIGGLGGVTGVSVSNCSFTNANATGDALGVRS